MQNKKSIKRENSKKEKSKLKAHSGITLIALIITIIVLLILAGVALATLTGDSGILSNAEKAKEQTEIAQIKELSEIVKQEGIINTIGNYDKTQLLQDLNNYFKGSTLGTDKVTVENGKYDIIVDSNLNIRVEKHEENEDEKDEEEEEELIAVNYKETEGNPGKIISLEIELLGDYEYNAEKLEKEFLENQFLVGKTTQELMEIAGKIKTEGTELTAEQVYNALLKAEVSTDTEEISYEEFMANKDAIVEEKYGYKTADLYAKTLILQMAENNINMNVGTMIPYAKKIVPELVGKDAPVIKETVEGYYNNEKTFDKILEEVFGMAGVTLDMLEVMLNEACYGTNLFSIEEIMLVVAEEAYANTHSIIVTKPDGSKENIAWRNINTVSEVGEYTALEVGDYTFEVTLPKGEKEEVIISSNGVGNLQKPAQAGKRFETDETIEIAGKTVSMPAGFTLSGATGECELVENGIVIYLIPKGTTVDWTNRREVLNAQKTYDQFVWVPIPKEDIIAVDMDGDNDIDTYDIDEMIAKERFPMAIAIGTNEDGSTQYRAVLYDFNLSSDGTKVEVTDKSYGTMEYWEPAFLYDADNGDGSTYNNVGIEGDTMQNSFDAMIAKVKSNGGFWVGRYETSNMVKGTSTNTAVNDATNKVTVIKGITTGIVDTTVTHDGTGLNWYRMYAQQKNYVDLYAETYDIETTRTSSMIWGSQWDQIMIWMRKIVNDKNTKTTNSFYVVNAVGMGSFLVNTEQTGKTDKYRVKNIYDMAGNVCEWTMEAYSMNRTQRGGNHSVFTPDITRPDARTGITPRGSYTNGGSRPTLY